MRDFIRQPAPRGKPTCSSRRAAASFNHALQPTAAALGILIVMSNYHVTGFGHVPLRRLWLSLGRSVSLAHWEERWTFRVSKEPGESLVSCRAEALGEADIGRHGLVGALGFRSHSQMEHDGLA